MLDRHLRVVPIYDSYLHYCIQPFPSLKVYIIFTCTIQEKDKHFTVELTQNWFKLCSTKSHESTPTSELRSALDTICKKKIALKALSESSKMSYSYTKPRGPIAAMFNSPGPCYALPGLIGHRGHDPRSVHERGPAFPLAGRHLEPDIRAGTPGPAEYLPDSKMLRTGRDFGPKFSFGGKGDRYSYQSTTPGPGAYAPENAGSVTRRSTTPSFSFGTKCRLKTRDEFPGN